jgi:RNA polymerase primary sigma factor
LYHTAEAESQLEQMVDSGGLASSGETPRIPKGLPPYLADLYRVPLLTPPQERSLFLKFNFHKCRFATLRAALEPEVALRRDLDSMEAELSKAQDVKNRITQANLRLVVSVARKHLQPGVNLMELVSEGNITLMRAIDSFDTKKGVRFSTYATLALMKGFARSVPELKMGAKSKAAGTRTVSFDATEIDVADRNSNIALDELTNRDQVDRLLSMLPERDRLALRSRFGLDGDADQAQSPSMKKQSDLALERLREVVLSQPELLLKVN